jgi:hypothetical protein
MSMQFTSADEFRVEKEPLIKLLGVLSQCGEVVSKFLKPTPSIRGRDDAQRLAEFLERFSDLATQTPLGHVEREYGPFSVLNRFEFEGSLVSIVLDGGCHRATAGLTVEDARRIVAQALDATFPAPFSDLLAYRFDSLDWCELTRTSTLSSAYVVWQSPRNLWWVLCVSDID